MDNFVKGEERDLDSVRPFDVELLENVVELTIKVNTKAHNLVALAEKHLNTETCRRILFVGVGRACTKTISCVEILKRRQNFTLHQITKAQFNRIEEFWEPLEQGLDRLKVNRDIPAIYILLSKDPLNTNDPGYQEPCEHFVPFAQQRQLIMRNQRKNQGGSKSNDAKRRENIWKRKNPKDKMTKTSNSSK